MSLKTQRVRDPIHGLIVFGGAEDQANRDKVAWQLLNTPEMQRLRRIRQLGVSETTFPGATHTRFAHSLGVFHVARQLMHILHHALPPDERDSHRADVALFAALLHDVGHGPFSHAFEGVQEARGQSKDHEQWTSEIIVRSTGKGDLSIRSILDGKQPGLAQEVADLLRADHPANAYYAIVSSSFDADRLDYLRRDRFMTGTGAGAIDFNWLLDNLDLGSISIGTDADDEVETVKTFCLKRKAL